MDDYRLIEEQLAAISQRLERIETTLAENNTQTLRNQVKLEDIEKQLLHLRENDTVLFNENRIIRESLVPKQDINSMFDKIREMENLPKDRNDKIVKWAVRILAGAFGTVLAGGFITVFVKLAALLE
jgi:chromosome segregation ATPase